MRKYFIVTVFSAMGIAIAFPSPQPASAFVVHQNGVAKVATATNAIIEVKRSPYKGRPPGWNHGRKVGWHGHSRPPGQI